MISKSLNVAIAAAVIAVAGVEIANAEAYTTRIEPRPFYGAVVTLEEGVRVIRPLPPERHVIINPGNATPLSLGFNETHVYENRTVRNYNYNEGDQSVEPSRRYGRAGFYGPSFGTSGYNLGRSGTMHHNGHGHRGGNH